MSGENTNFFGGLTLDNLSEDQKENFIEVNTDQAQTTTEKTDGTENVDKKTEVSQGKGPDMIEINDTGGGSDNNPSPSKNSSSDQQHQQNENPLFNSFAVVLHEEGVLSSFDPEKDKFKSFKEIVEKLNLQKEEELKAKIEEYKSSINPDLKSLVEGDEAGASLEKLANLKLEERALNSVTEEKLKDEKNTEMRKLVITSNLKKTTALSDEKIKKLVDNYVEKGEDIQEALEAVVNLKTLNQQAAQKEVEDAKLQKKNREDSAKQTLDNLKKMVEETTEFFPGNKADKTFKTKVYDALTKVIEKDEKTGNQYSLLTKKRAENPLKFDMITAALVVSGAYDGKWDAINPNQKKSVYEELERAIQSSEKQKSAGGQRTKSGSSASILESLKQI